MLNKKYRSRRLIISIVIPAYLFIIACYIAESQSYRGNPFEISSSWWVWMIYIGLVAYIEDIIYSR